MKKGIINLSYLVEQDACSYTTEAFENHFGDCATLTERNLLYALDMEELDPWWIVKNGLTEFGKQVFEIRTHSLQICGQQYAKVHRELWDGAKGDEDHAEMRRLTKQKNGYYRQSERVFMTVLAGMIKENPEAVLIPELVEEFPDVA